MSDGQLFFQLLFLVQVRIVAIRGEQLVMAADFDNPARDQHRNLVSVTHRRYAMRDKNRGAAVYQLQSTQDRSSV